MVPGPQFAWVAEAVGINAHIKQHAALNADPATEPRSVNQGYWRTLIHVSMRDESNKKKKL